MTTIIFGGLILGAIYTMVAHGYNMVLLATGSFNFSQAALVMFGTFLASMFGTDSGLNPVVVIILCGLVGAVIGVVTELVAIRPLAGRGSHGELVTTIGVSTILIGGVTLIWGESVRPVAPLVSDQTIELANGLVTIDGLILIAIAGVLTVLLWAWANFSMGGLASVAVSSDRAAAILRGINVNRLSLAMFAAAGALGGALGPIVGTQTLAIFTVATAITVKSFVALTLGGFNSFPGAWVGGVVVGLIEALTTRYLGAQYALLALFVLFLGILLLRPQGIFGQRPERIV